MKSSSGKTCPVWQGYLAESIETDIADGPKVSKMAESTEKEKHGDQ